MRRFAMRLAVTIAIAMLCALGGFAALGYLTLALYLYLATLFEPPMAALVTAFGILVATLVLALIARLFIPKKKSPLEQLGEALSLGSKFGSESREKLHTEGFSKITIALFGLGFAMGVSPKLRALVLGLLR